MALNTKTNNASEETTWGKFKKYCESKTEYRMRSKIDRKSQKKFKKTL